MLHFVVQRFFLVLPLISRFLPTYSATEDNNTIKIWEFKDTSLYSLGILTIDYWLIKPSSTNTGTFYQATQRFSSELSKPAKQLLF